MSGTAGPGDPDSSSQMGAQVDSGTMDGSENGTAARVEARTGENDRHQRLDKFLVGVLPDLSRSYLQQLIADGRVWVDGEVRRPSFPLLPAMTVTVNLPPREEDVLRPEEIPLDIVFENEDVIVLNKPAGLVVHPAPGHPSGTLVNALLAHAPDISVGGGRRPGIVHRLDKDTSGLMVVAKSDRARNSLVAQWNAQRVRKRYIALVSGRVDPNDGTIDAPIGRDPLQRRRMAVIAKGRPAVSHFTVRERFSRTTLLDVEIDTGRTHQIRVHLAFIGHPVVGDGLYNRSGQRALGAGDPQIARQFLHASRLAFQLPRNGDVVFDSAMPPDLEAIVRALRRAGT